MKLKEFLHVITDDIRIEINYRDEEGYYKYIYTADKTINKFDIKDKNILDCEVLYINHTTILLEQIEPYYSITIELKEEND